MGRKPLNTAILTGALVVFFALPSSALAGQVVPPGNSAVTQYTQTFPTAGGNAELNETLNGDGAAPKKSPEKVLGHKTSSELESHGSEGEKVAEIAAESAPETTVEPETEAETAESSPPPPSNGNKGGGNNHKQHQASKPHKGGGAQQQTGGTASTGGGSVVPGANDGKLVSETSAGDSGVSQVLGQLTGSSSDGKMGLFLPLALLVALGWALFMVWRRRQAEHGTPR